MEKILDPRGYSDGQVLKAYRALIYKSLSSYCQRGDLWEDLEQEAALAVLEAKRSFDPEKGVAFPHYVKTRIKYQIFAYQRKLWALEAGEGSEEDLGTVESGVNLEEDLVKKEEGALLRKRLGALSPRQRQVLILEYREGLGLSEIAGYLGLSYKTVENTKAAGMKKLRRMYDLK